MEIAPAPFADDSTSRSVGGGTEFRLGDVGIAEVEQEIKQRVVPVSLVAEATGRDASSTLRRLKKLRFNVFKVTDPVSGQLISVIRIEDWPDVRTKLVLGDYDIVRQVSELEAEEEERTSL